MGPPKKKLKDLVVLIKGAGEMATGVAHRLARSGFRVGLTEIAEPLAVRREVAFSEAIFAGEKMVESLVARRVSGREEIFRAWKEGRIPVLVDPECSIRKELEPDVIVDAILAKKNTGTGLGDASLVIGLGPGFRAGQDVHIVIETNRGHHLGRLIEKGEAAPDTGVPGDISGFTWERVLRAPVEGKFRGMKQIGDRVDPGEAAGEVSGDPVEVKIAGVLRGILRDGIWVQQRMKVGDVDPRGVRDYCFTISEKARAIAGGVLEGILWWYNK